MANPDRNIPPEQPSGPMPDWFNHPQGAHFVRDLDPDVKGIVVTFTLPDTGIGVETQYKKSNNRNILSVTRIDTTDTQELTRRLSSTINAPAVLSNTFYSVADKYHSISYMEGAFTDKGIRAAYNNPSEGVIVSAHYNSLGSLEEISMGPPSQEDVNWKQRSTIDQLRHLGTLVETAGIRAFYPYTTEHDPNRIEKEADDKMLIDLDEAGLKIADYKAQRASLSLTIRGLLEQDEQLVLLAKSHKELLAKNLARKTIQAWMLHNKGMPPTMNSVDAGRVRFQAIQTALLYTLEDYSRQAEMQTHEKIILEDANTYEVQTLLSDVEDIVATQKLIIDSPDIAERTYTYEDRSYVVARTPTGEVTVALTYPENPPLKKMITIKEAIAIERWKHIMETPDQTGWELVMDYYPLSITNG